MPVFLCFLSFFVSLSCDTVVFCSLGDLRRRAVPLDRSTQGQDMTWRVFILRPAKWCRWCRWLEFAIPRLCGQRPARLIITTTHEASLDKPRLAGWYWGSVGRLSGPGAATAASLSGPLGGCGCFFFLRARGKRGCGFGMPVSRSLDRRSL